MSSLPGKNFVSETLAPSTQSEPTPHGPPAKTPRFGHKYNRNVRRPLMARALLCKRKMIFNKAITFELRWTPLLAALALAYSISNATEPKCATDLSDHPSTIRREIGLRPQALGPEDVLFDTQIAQTAIVNHISDAIRFFPIDPIREMGAPGAVQTFVQDKLICHTHLAKIYLANGKISVSDYVLLKHFQREIYSIWAFILDDFQANVMRAKNQDRRDSDRARWTWREHAAFTAQTVHEVLRTEFEPDISNNKYFSQAKINSLAKLLQVGAERGKALNAIPILATRQNEDSTVYRDLIRELEKWNVGGANGHADRRIVADVFLAQTTDSQRPVFVTADRNLIRGLLQLKSRSTQFGNATMKAISERNVAYKTNDIEVVQATTTWPGREGPQGQSVYRTHIQNIAIGDSLGEVHTIDVYFYFSPEPANWVFDQMCPSG